jgi:hypothetical protein
MDVKKQDQRATHVVLVHPEIFASGQSKLQHSNNRQKRRAVALER